MKLYSEFYRMSSQYFPPTQCDHEDEVQYLPGAAVQSEHLDAPDAACLPALQAEHAEAPDAANAPALQLCLSLEPPTQ